MCGLCGLIRPSPDTGTLSRMLGQLTHRGPDHAGTWTGSLGPDLWVGLGHRRLSIVDLSTDAAQPMEDPDGTLVVVFNGEIYNHEALRSELAASGACFRTRSDTEVLLHAYRLWGDELMSHLNGMFALAVLDRSRGTLLCARDRFGEKPFLYSFDGGCFAFASEYKAILQCPHLSLDVDEVRLVQSCLRDGLGLDSDRETVFPSVNQLLPAQAMLVDLPALTHRTWTYWSIAPTTGPSAPFSLPDAAAELRHLLTDAVKLRLRADVPVGSCLSGGLDSSSIVMCARRILGPERPYHTFTATFPGTDADEWYLASTVVEAAATTSHLVQPGPAGFLSDLPDFVWYNDLPLNSAVQYAQWAVFRLARQQGVVVLLDGQGSDELLGGYPRYFGPYLQALREAGDHARLAREAPLIRSRHPPLAPPLWRRLAARLPLGLRGWLASVTGRGANLLHGLRPDVARRLVDVADPPRRPAFNALVDVLERDTCARSLTTCLRAGDRSSMAHSLETRLPFCDHRLAEFVFRLPPQAFMAEGQTKFLLRQAMRGILPEPVLASPIKRGFLPPQTDWFGHGPFLDLVHDVFSSAAFNDNPLWNAAWIRQAVPRLRKGNRALTWTLWKPLMIELWRTHFLERVARERSASC